MDLTGFDVLTGFDGLIIALIIAIVTQKKGQTC